MTDTTTLAPCPFCGAPATGHAIEAHEHSAPLRALIPGLPDHPGSYVIEGDCACGSGLIGETQAEVTERWNRRAPAPASGETETCKCCGEGSARIVVRRECDTCTSVYSGVAEHRLQKSLAAPPAQEARVPLSDAEALAIVRSVPALVTAEEEWLWAIREVEKYHGITAAQKETPCAPTP